jgi:2-amino-4-hydroxy-6-hydroxymethyldihydropteridine diphosphokinase
MVAIRFTTAFDERSEFLNSVHLSQRSVESCLIASRTANSKQQTANSKQQTANSKQQTANSKQRIRFEALASFRSSPVCNFHSILTCPNPAVYCLLITVCCSLMPTAYIGLGSNLGDRAGNLLLGIRGLMDSGLTVSRLSHIYETEPVETYAQPSFLNMVGELNGETLPPPAELMELLLQVELSLGRTRDRAKGPRTIDLDLLLCDEVVCDTPRLTLPHPRLHQRRFVLVPFAEIAPNLVHPVLNNTMINLLKALDDVSEVKLWKP